MKCFYHPEADAVGICKNCARGICRRCAFEMTSGIACKDRCESELRAINEQILRARKTLNAGPLIATLIGGAFLFQALLIVSSNLGMALVIIAVSAMFLIAAGVSYRASKRPVRQ